MGTGSNRSSNPPASWRPWPVALLLLAPGLLLAAPTHEKTPGRSQVFSHPPGGPGEARAGGAQDVLDLSVRQGDTLIGISQRYLDSPLRWRELRRLNRVADARQMRPGTQLHIPVEWLRWSELPVEVVYVNGTVIGNSGPLAAGMRLKAGDGFDTGAESSVTLRFSDGAVAVFTPGTKASLGVSREAAGDAGLRATRIDLRQGAVETTVTPLTQPASRFDVRTPRVVTAVRGTRFRVAAQDEVSRHEVVSGLVSVAGASAAPLDVGSGQGVRAEAGLPGALTRLLPAPDLSGLPTLVERTAQPLLLPSMPQVVGWRWQVAADGGFTRLLQDVKTASPAWLLTGLPDGGYYLRVRAADAQELEGSEAQVAFMLAARPEPPLRISPPTGARVPAGAALTWAEVADAPSYHLQLARDANFADLVLERPGLAGNRLPLDVSLPPGPYHWRIATQRPDGSRGPFGDAGAFTVLEPSSVAAPEVGTGGLHVAWSGTAGFAHRVQVSVDPGFSTTELDQVVQGASLDLPSPKPGTYQVRTRIVLPDGSNGPWSAVQRFEVPTPAPEPGRPWYLLLLLLPLL